MTTRRALSIEIICIVLLLHADDRVDCCYNNNLQYIVIRYQSTFVYP